MAEKKISQLPAYTTPTNVDILPIVDITNLITKKITWGSIISNIISSITSSFVPYTGATSDVNLGTHIISTDSINLNATPQPIVTDRQTFWDNNAKTLATRLNSSVTLQHGQEMLDYVYNGTGSLLTNGTIVYQSGLNGEFSSVAGANASDPTKRNVIAMLTQDIATGTFGYATTQGSVHGLNTSAYGVNTVLYLSDSVDGAFTSTAPTHAIIIGTVQVQDAVNGVIRVNIQSGQSLSALSDTNIGTPGVGQSLIWNGTDWVNASNTVASVGPGVSFYNDNTSILPATTNNVNVVDTLSKYPITTTEVVDIYSANNNTVLGEAYSNGVLGRTTIDAGTWTFNTWCSVSSITAGRISSLTRAFNQIIQGVGTVTTTGTGTTRTATVTGGTPFISGDVNADITKASYLQTPQGLYRITAFTSSSVVTISVPSTYANEAGASYWKWSALFTINTGPITFIGTSYGLITTSVAQPAFTINATDKVGSIIYATSNALTSVYFVHNGNSRYSYFTSPIVASHQDLALLQGGNATERYHMTQAQNTSATRYANGTQDGLISSADWTTFNGKQATLGFTAENVANKATTMSGNTASTTIYLAAKAVYDWGVATFAALAGNIAQSFGALNIELGHASDTTIARVSAGVVSIEGNNILTANTGLPLSGGTMTGKIVSAGTAEVAKTYAPASGSQTVTIDCSVNNQHEVTGNSAGTAITFAVTNATNSQIFIVTVTQGASTLSTIAGWFATVRWIGGTPPTLTATANKRDVFGFRRTGSSTYDGFVIGQNI